MMTDNLLSGKNQQLLEGYLTYCISKVLTKETDDESNRN